MVTGIPEFQRLAAAVDGGGCPAAFTGLSPVHRAHMAAGLRQALGRSVVVLCADEAEADRMARDLAFLTGEPVRTLTAREFTFHNAAVASRQWTETGSPRRFASSSWAANTSCCRSLGHSSSQW